MRGFRRTVASRRGGEQTPFALGREEQCRADIVGGEVWKVGEYLLLRHAACKVLENVGDGNAGVLDHGFTATYGRIDFDAIMVVHLCGIRDRDSLFKERRDAPGSAS